MHLNSNTSKVTCVHVWLNLLKENLNGTGHFYVESASQSSETEVDISLNTVNLLLSGCTYLRFTVPLFFSLSMITL